jgi:cytochrome c oxidase subunit III
METLAHQFDDVDQQREASTLGMWIFLATEVLFFGGMLLAYSVYRSMYFSAFGEASRQLDIVLGSLNTAVLLCSSLTMAMAVHEAESGSGKWLVRFLGLTMLLGTVFLAIKFYEYYEKYKEGLIPGAHFTWHSNDPGHASLFFIAYFILTGIHALHMIIGIGMMGILARLARKGRFTPAYYTPIELGGLYWHFVDIVWVFLFPLLYLVHRS